MIWHKLRSLPCKIQRASLQLFCLLMSYLLLRWHWNMCNKFLLAFFTFFFLATFLIRLGKKKATSSSLSEEVTEITFFYLFCQKKPDREWSTLQTQEEGERDQTTKECDKRYIQILLLDIFSIAAYILHMAFPLLWHGHERKAIFPPLPQLSGCHSKAIAKEEPANQQERKCFKSMCTASLDSSLRLPSHTPELGLQIMR